MTGPKPKKPQPEILKGAKDREIGNLVRNYLGASDDVRKASSDEHDSRGAIERLAHALQKARNAARQYGK